MSQEPTELGQNPGGPSEAGPHCLSHAVPCGCGSPSARKGTCLPCLAAGRGGQPLAGLCSSPELRAHLLPPADCVLHRCSRRSCWVRKW